MLSLWCLNVSFESATAWLGSSSKSAHCGHVTSIVSSRFCCLCLRSFQKWWLPHSSFSFTGVTRKCSLSLHYMHLSDKSIWQQSSMVMGLIPPFATLPPIIRMHNSNSWVAESHITWFIFCHALTQQPATRTTQPLTRSSPLQWDREEDGQKLKLVGWHKDRLIRQQRNYYYYYYYY